MRFSQHIRPLINRDLSKSNDLIKRNIKIEASQISQRYQIHCNKQVINKCLLFSIPRMRKTQEVSTWMVPGMGVLDPTGTQGQPPQQNVCGDYGSPIGSNLTLGLNSLGGEPLWWWNLCCVKGERFFLLKVRRKKIRWERGKYSKQTLWFTAICISI